MSVPMRCKACGLNFTARYINFSGTTNAGVSNYSEDCPRCGGDAVSQNGRYDFVGSAIAAFRAPGVTRQKVERFAEVARAAQAGAIKRTDADAQIAELSRALASLWKFINDNGSGISVLLAVIAIWLTITAGWDDDIAADKQLKETQTQTAMMRSSEQVQQKILEELQKRPQADREMVGLQPYGRWSPKVSPPQTAARTFAPNRKERRKAKAISRRSSR